MKSIWKLNTISTEKVSSYNLTHKITNFPKGKSPKMICYQLKNIADDRKWFQSQSMHILDMENILLPSIYWQYLKPFIILCNSLFGTGPECDDVSGGKVPSPDSGGGRGGDGTTGNGALGPGVSSPRCPLPPPLPPETRGHELSHLPPKCGTTGHWSRGRGGVWRGLSTKFRESFHRIWRKPLLEQSPP